MDEIIDAVLGENAATNFAAGIELAVGAVLGAATAGATGATGAAHATVAGAAGGAGASALGISDAIKSGLYVKLQEGKAMLRARGAGWSDEKKREANAAYLKVEPALHRSGSEPVFKI